MAFDSSGRGAGRWVSYPWSYHPMKTRPLSSLLFCLPFLIATALVSPRVAADEQKLISEIRTGIAHSAYFGLSIEGDKGLAVGLAGSILESNDGGVTWSAVEETNVEPSLALLAVDLGGDHAIAVGQMGIVVIESEPAKWTRVDAGFEGRMLTVSVNKAGLAVIGGEFGEVLKSEDGGKTWASNQPDWLSLSDPDTFGTAEPHVYAVHVAENGDVTLAGEFGVILRQAAGSDEWAVIKELEPRAPTLFALHINEAEGGYSFAVGQTGEILRSSDGGASWQSLAIAESDANFLGVTTARNGRVVITGMRVMLVSDNNGDSWTAVEEGDTTTDWYQAIRVHEQTGRVIAVGHTGRIIQIGS